jgi:hypothetical protein
MHFLPSLVTFAGLFSISAAESSQPSQPECISHSLPNPIASQFPANVTGTINSTLAILPLPIKLARSIIPEQYEILSDAWRELLPSLPKDMYPALLYTVRDHDVGLGDYKIDDFSVCYFFLFLLRSVFHLEIALGISIEGLNRLTLSSALQ